MRWPGIQFAESAPLVISVLKGQLHRRNALQVPTVRQTRQPVTFVQLDRTVLLLRLTLWSARPELTVGSRQVLA